MTMTPDKKALKILFDTYWSSRGWVDQDARITTPADLAYAKDAGVVFDPVDLTHDEIIARALAAREGVEPGVVGDAFVASLTSRRLDQRSALGSFALLRELRAHSAPRSTKACPVCGEYGLSRCPQDISVLSFERFKWGGVRHDKPIYAAFDLEQFVRYEPSRPTTNDVDALRRLFQLIRDVPASTTAANLQKHLSPAIRSNKAEREVLIGILGLCGVLATQEHPGHFPHFVPYAEREAPARRFVDMAYPACWWQGDDGLNDEAIDFWFGHLL